MKKLLFIQRIFRGVGLLFSFSLSLISFGYTQEIEWQNTIGGTSIEQIYSIQQTTDGGYILGGHSSSDISGDKTENSNGLVDYWVVKTDAIGNILWQNTIGGSESDILRSIQQTADGGYILGGESRSNISGDKTENNWDITMNSCDYWIVKTDASGNILWQNTIGGFGFDQLYSLQQTSDGGYILGGCSDSDISGDKTENSNGVVDYWIVKTDASGNIQWQNTIGGSAIDNLFSIHQTSDGGYILGGRSYSNISGDKTEICLGGNDYWIIKTDSTGNIQWQNTIGGVFNDELLSIQQTLDSGYILGGWSNSNISGDKTENSIGGMDYWIVKTDVTGNIQWQETIGGNNSDYLYCVQQTSDGGYILGGYSFSNISGDKTENSIGNWDYWVVKTNAIGNIQWQTTIGGSSGDFLYSISQTTDEGFIICGISNSNISGDKVEGCIGNHDYWIVKLTEKFNSITGKLFNDANVNQLQDAGELPLQFNQVTEFTSGKFAFSNQNGNYNLVVLDSGNFSASPVPISYYNTVPANHTAYFPGFQQTDSLNDFAFQPAGVFNDLCVSITPLGAFRAGFDASYMINYTNVGTTILSPTVIFFPDNPVTYVSANPVANSVIADSIVWNFGPLAPFQTGSILVTVNVSVGTPIGTLINSGVRIEPVAGDANTVCNYANWEVYTTGAVDPNAILVDRDTVFTTELSNPAYLDYIIYFQNTGNDTAFNARVLNNIPINLDVASFEFVASSHPMNITYGAHARLFTFTFDNILLPDSNTNEPASHGFIRYRIKPLNSLVVGDSIKNTAFIYFDFNQPVQTNTVVTEIVLTTDLTPGPSPKERGVAVYPNPTTGTLTITVKPLRHLAEGLEGLVITDLFGRKVFELQTLNIKPQTTIDVSSFSNGVYFVEVAQGIQISRAKFVKQ